MQTYTIRTKDLGSYDVVVLGGGIAGVFAAVTAAKEGMRVLLCEAMGCLGGTMTSGLVTQVLDRDNKGGLIRQMYDDLNAREMTCPRYGARIGQDGKKLPGAMIDIEGTKVWLEKLCQESGVRLMFYARVADVQVEEQKITGVLIASETGNYHVQGKIFIDATGCGALAALAGLRWEIGQPETGYIQPASMGSQVIGMPWEFNDIGNEAEKTAYGNMLRDNGLEVSGGQAGAIRLPSIGTWLYNVNLEYNVHPEDPFALTDATVHGRRECVDASRIQATFPGYKDLWMVSGSEHLGIREGRRVFGRYRLTVDDILTGAKFEDAVCTVRFAVDIHRLHPKDTYDLARGYKTKPYHLPYRCMLPESIDNLLLAGKLISGDFYAHASYRVLGNMGATGEAAGWAAAQAIRADISPAQVDGKAVSAFMKARGYEI